MLAYEKVEKRFGRHEVLRGVNVEFQPGRVTALIGPNGAGKTTLVKCALGLVRPDGGRLVFDGAPIGDDPAYRRRIGYMPQIARFPENLSGAELLAMIRELRGPGVLTDEELLRSFDLASALGKPLRTLSGGTRQKVNASLAMLFRPDLLILDEPTAGLDPLSSSILKDKVRAERERGCAVILTSHIMSELEELADDVVYLCDGVARFAGSMHDLKLHTRQFNLERAIAHIMKEHAA